MSGLYKPSYSAYISAIATLKIQRAALKAKYILEDNALEATMQETYLRYRTDLEAYKATQPGTPITSQSNTRKHVELRALADRATAAYDHYAEMTREQSFPQGQRFDAKTSKRLSREMAKARRALQDFEFKQALHQPVDAETTLATTYGGTEPEMEDT